MVCITNNIRGTYSLECAQLIDVDESLKGAGGELGGDRFSFGGHVRDSVAIHAGIRETKRSATSDCIDAFTETKKQSPNTGARANNTLHK